MVKASSSYHDTPRKEDFHAILRGIHTLCCGLSSILWWSHRLEIIYIDLSHWVYTRLMMLCNMGNALKIMEAYGVVSQVWCLWTFYWYCETMVERARGYYRDPFQGFWGVTHVGPSVPPYLYFCGRRDCLSLGWGLSGKLGRPWQLQIHGDVEGSAILCRWRPHYIHQASEAAVRLWRTHWYIQVGWSKI